MPRKSTKNIVPIDEPESVARKPTLESQKDTKGPKGPKDTSVTDQKGTADLKDIKESKESSRAHAIIHQKLSNAEQAKTKNKVTDLINTLSNLGLNHKTNEQTPVIVQTLFVPQEERRTKSIMTLYEFCSVLSIRAQQISNNSPIFVDIGNLTNVNEIAMKEIKEKKCPLCVQRVLKHYPNGNKLAEIWEVNEMAIPDEYAQMKFE